MAILDTDDERIEAVTLFFLEMEDRLESPRRKELIVIPSVISMLYLM